MLRSTIQPHRRLVRRGRRERNLGLELLGKPAHTAALRAHKQPMHIVRNVHIHHNRHGLNALLGLLHIGLDAHKPDRVLVEPFVDILGIRLVLRFAVLLGFVVGRILALAVTLCLLRVVLLAILAILAVLVLLGLLLLLLAALALGEIDHNRKTFADLLDLGAIRANDVRVVCRRNREINSHNVRKRLVNQLLGTLDLVRGTMHLDLVVLARQRREVQLHTGALLNRLFQRKVRGTKQPLLLLGHLELVVDAQHIVLLSNKLKQTRLSLVDIGLRAIQTHGAVFDIVGRRSRSRSGHGGRGGLWALFGILVLLGVLAVLVLLALARGRWRRCRLRGRRGARGLRGRLAAGLGDRRARRHGLGLCESLCGRRDVQCAAAVGARVQIACRRRGLVCGHGRNRGGDRGRGRAVRVVVVHQLRAECLVVGLRGVWEVARADRRGHNGTHGRRMLVRCGRAPWLGGRRRRRRRRECHWENHLVGHRAVPRQRRRRPAAGRGVDRQIGAREPMRRVLECAAARNDAFAPGAFLDCRRRGCDIAAGACTLAALAAVRRAALGVAL
eukprot:comp22451_c0_seq2/m.55220 comp22451_c0_seq2/g.55220  ORF comp22451_c0_seq2/g.55220 comp22451_c0_seq2/m.55220 type:complete len:558 (+) comp22451_c0_seq2:1284-2957(+)